MLDQLQLWMFGVAALIDTVLLFAFIERPNRRAVTVWMLLLAFGVWCWHAGSFLRLLVNESVGPLADPVRWLSMVAMALGLLLMPSAALHGTCRLLEHDEFRQGARLDPRLMGCYAPLILLIPMSRSLAAAPAQSFLDLLAAYRMPYVAWLCAVSGLATYALFRSARKVSDPPARRFYWWQGACMLAIAVLVTTFNATLSGYLPPVAGLATITALSPLVPALLFAYFIMRFQLLPLVLERTLVYGAILMGTLLFHQLVLRDVLSHMEGRYRLNFGVIEGVAALAIVLLYQPLRLRVAEALQSLVDSPLARRSERQRLAVELASHAGDSPSELLAWFTTVMRQSFGGQLGAAWLCQPDGAIIERAGAADVLDDAEVPALIRAIGHELYATRFTARDSALIEFLDRVRAGALLKFEHPELSGLFLVGCRRWGQPPTDEDLHALSLLVEQFGVTVHNSKLLALQVAAEHRVLQQEKLSTLGLIAGSLAHEIKNPLSSIKTIARVLAEELGPESPYAEDLNMIRQEIERLTASTSELLDVARPFRTDRPPGPLEDHLSPTIRLLQHLARERQAELAVMMPEKTVTLSLDHVSLREIVFNLTSNALEAAGSGGQVRLICRCDPEALILEVHDNGPGFPPEQLATLSQPFFTTKPTGTGLGLYIVARRVRDIGGQLECRSRPHEGTMFAVRLPRG